MDREQRSVHKYISSATCNAVIDEKDKRGGHSSDGRAPALQAGGRRFDPAWLHQNKTELSAYFKWALTSAFFGN